MSAIFGDSAAAAPTGSVRQALNAPIDFHGQTQGADIC